jgi:hypothetical protein
MGHAVKKETRVYFVRPVGMDGPIKIGCSAKPMDRIKVLSAWSPFELELIGSVPGSFDDENMLHRRFSNLHTRKEWFLSSAPLRETIERIIGGTPIRDACAMLEEKGPIRNQNRPLKTPDRALFLEYGYRIRRELDKLRKDFDFGIYHAPDDIKAIMHNWRRDKMKNHSPITPTPEQFARLEEFIADPGRHAVFRKWTHNVVKLQEQVAA